MRWQGVVSSRGMTGHGTVCNDHEKSYASGPLTRPTVASPNPKSTSTCTLTFCYRALPRAATLPCSSVLCGVYSFSNGTIASSRSVSSFQCKSSRPRNSSCDQRSRQHGFQRAQRSHAHTMVEGCQVWSSDNAHLVTEIKF